MYVTVSKIWSLDVILKTEKHDETNLNNTTKLMYYHKVGSR